MNAWTFARLALVFLWLATALVSVTSGQQIGYDILSSGGIDGVLADFCVYGGAALDLLLGLWLLTGMAPLACLRVQGAVVLLYSLLLSLVDPGFWAHPFGPLTKNLPVLALILLLHQRQARGPWFD
ncbi:NAD-dependent dehydratase [Pseudomonas sp. BN417]|uniref:DoxX-like family protein n=1 Tax=Pseudomonas sp. BN417 TaxID=2567890 RepID=UPI00245695F7|nr:DoxX-like family protein [Pseudomonas sp. BN417]MDH4555365.1 NAD-dependent dehydratase [Pseudomonas sp. BN417]